MGPPTKSDEFELPSRTLGGQAARIIERVCITAARWSIPLFIPVGCLLVLYVIGGYTAVSVGIWTPGYEFLSLSEDVYFAWLGFVFGITICVGTGSLIGLAFLNEGEGGSHTDISILSSFVGFGFGAGIIRMTSMTVIATLL
jgi:hypothetical protein